MKILLLSPHLDDATLSLGGTIPRLSVKNQVMVYNFFGVSSSMRLQARFPVPLVVLVRWTEEILASRLQGYGFRNLLFRDTSLTRRRGRPEGALFRQVAGAVEWALEREGPDIVLSPLAVGRHPDHLALFDALARSVSVGRIRMEHCMFYEDMWYSGRTDPSARADEAGNELSTLLRPFLIDITDTVELKKRSCQLYRSQYPMSARKIQRVFEYARALQPQPGAGKARSFERIWVPSSSGTATPGNIERFPVGADVREDTPR